MTTATFWSSYVNELLFNSAANAASITDDLWGLCLVPEGLVGTTSLNTKTNRSYSHLKTITGGAISTASYWSATLGSESLATAYTYDAADTAFTLASADSGNMDICLMVNRNSGGPTEAHNDDQLIAYYELDSALSPNGQTINVEFNSDGIFQLGGNNATNGGWFWSYLVDLINDPANMGFNLGDSTVKAMLFPSSSGPSTGEYETTSFDQMQYLTTACDGSGEGYSGPYVGSHYINMNDTGPTLTYTGSTAMVRMDATSIVWADAASDTFGANDILFIYASGTPGLTSKPLFYVEFSGGPTASAATITATWDNQQLAKIGGTIDA